MSHDDMPTLIPCLACGGEFEITSEAPDGFYKKHVCRWCTRGAMSLQQLRDWREFSEKRKTDPPCKG